MICDPRYISRDIQRSTRLRSVPAEMKLLHLREQVFFTNLTARIRYEWHLILYDYRCTLLLIRGSDDPKYPD